MLVVFFSWQFFLTYRSCKHLDGKHSVFGRVVGGAETTLSAMERVGTDNKDRPVEDIVIEKAQVFVDPFEEVDEQVINKLNTSAQRPPLKNILVPPVHFALCGDPDPSGVKP